MKTPTTDDEAFVEIKRIRQEIVEIRNWGLMKGHMDLAVYLSHSIEPLSDIIIQLDEKNDSN